MTSRTERATDTATRYTIITTTLLQAVENDPDATTATRERTSTIRRSIPLQPRTATDLDTVRRAATDLAELRIDEEHLNGWLPTHHLDAALAMLEAARQVLTALLNHDWPDN